MEKISIKKKILLSIMTIVLLLATVVGGIFAYYEITNKGWGQKISSTNVIFKVNGHDYSEIGSNDLKLTRGDPKAVNLVVAVTSNNTGLDAYMKYDINFVLGKDSELANAIEIYSYIDGIYVFKGMLNKLNKISSYLPINTSYTYPMVFVLSESAGAYYDAKGFTLSVEVSNELIPKANVDASEVIGDNSRVYVKDAATFETALKDPTSEGKIITLLKDITLSAPVTVTKKLGIDLNGFNLTLNNDINITYSGSLKPGEFGIVNNSINPSLIDGTGKINVTSDDCFITGDNLSASYERINIVNLAKGTAIENLVTARTATLNKEYLTGDKFNILANLGYYFNNGYSAIYTEQVFSVTNNSFTVKIAPEATTPYIYSLQIKSDTFTSAVINGNMSVRGASEKAIATSLLSEIPASISSSHFLKSYDSVTKSSITWIIEDGEKGNLFSDVGLYLKNGYDALTSWRDRELKITVKVSKGNYQHSESVTRKITVLTAEQRTKLLYTNAQYILKEVGEVVDISLNLNLVETRAELLSVKVTFDDAKNTTPDGLKYLKVQDGNSTAYDKIIALNKPQNSAIVPTTFTFTYQTGEGVTTYALVKDIVLLGGSSSFDVNNAQNLLQAPFDSNNYINDTAYSFEILSKTSEKTFVEYSVDNVFSKYVLVKTTTANNTLTSSVTVLPGNVPPLDTLVTVKAKLFELNESGQKTYIKDINNKDLEYLLTFTVKGIYHNIPSEIPNFNVYQTMLEYYDFNNDGYIGKAEAERPWIKNGANNLKKAPTVSDGNKYIDLSNKSVTSLKGLEYFTGALGYNLSTNKIVDLDAFSGLNNLSYLNLNSNLIASIENLKYLDSLSYLSLESNNITSIEALRYLENIKYLSVKGNTVTDYSPLLEYKKLTYLNIYAKNSDYTASDETQYYLTLIMANSSLNTVYSSSETVKYTVADDAKVMAKLLYNLEKINQIYQTLYLPREYYYNGIAYEIQWLVAQNDYITLTPADKIYNYTITTPSTTFPVNFSIKVRKLSTDEFSTMSRKMTVKLLESSDKTLRIETKKGTYGDAYLIVPDDILRNILFETFNTTKTDTLIGTTGFSEKYTITQAEITAAAKTDRIWNDKGIKDLTGLQYFKATMKGVTLNLKGNKFNEVNGYGNIEELSSLIYGANGLNGLVLGGQKYDFSTLLLPYQSGYNDSATLTTFDVSGCYNLNDQDVLDSLYKVYINNKNVKIYKDSPTTLWNPYEKTLANYVKNLPTLFTFMNINEVCKFFESGSAFFITFYNYKTIEFKITDVSFSGYNATSVFEYVKPDNSNITGVRYKTLVGYDTTYFANVLIRGEDGRNINFNGIGTPGITYDNYFVQLQANLNYNIKVKDVAADSSAYVTIDKIFDGRTLRTAVMSSLKTYLGNATNKVNTLAEVTAGKFYKEKDKDNYYISSALFASLNLGSALSLDSSYFGNNVYDNNGALTKGLAISGLRFLPQIKSLTFTTNAYFGSGYELVHLEEIIFYASYLDLGTLTIALPKLTTLTAKNDDSSSNAHVVLYRGDEYYLRFFPNITNLNLVQTAITDWNGLRGILPAYWGNRIWDSATNSFKPASTADIAAAEKTVKLKTLDIYGTVGSTYTNKNSNLKLATDIIFEIYNRVIANGVLKDDIIYHIGSKTNNNDPTAKFPFEGQTGGETLDPTLEYKEFYDKIKELDVKVTPNGGTAEYVFNTGKEEITAGDTISLPTDTSWALQTLYGDTSIFNRKFAINWTIYGINTALSGNKLSDIFTSNLTDLATLVSSANNGMSYINLGHLNGGITLSPISTVSDYYFVLVGTIGDGYFNNDGKYVAMSGTTKTSFQYPFLIKGATDATPKTNSLSNFEDYLLRFLVFSRYTDNRGGYVEVSGNSGVSKTTSFSISAATYNAFSLDVTYGDSIVKVAFGTVLDATGAKSPCENVLASINTLNGISKFTSVTELKITSKNVYDITDLAKMTQLTTVNLSKNKISSLAPLKLLPNLSSLIVSENVITDGGSFLAGSLSKANLTTFDISYNPHFSATDMANIADFTALTTLNVSGTKCDNSFLALEKINGISSLTKLSINGNEATVDATFKTKLAGFIAECKKTVAGSIGAIITNGYKHTEATTIDNIITTDIGTYHYKFNSNIVGANRLKLGKTVKAPMVVTLDGYPALSAKFEIDYKNEQIGNAAYIIYNGVNYTTDTTATNKTVIDIDGALWSYLITNCTNNTGTVNTGFTLNTATLDIKSNYNIQSLKGINTFGFTSISITSNPITSLWSSTATANTALTNLKLEGATLKAQDLACLYGASNLATLDLSKSFGINYDDIIPLRDNSSKKLSVMLSEITALKTLYVNNEYLYLATGASGNKIFNGKSAKINYMKYLTTNLVFTNANKLMVGSYSASGNYYQPRYQIQGYHTYFASSKFYGYDNTADKNITKITIPLNETLLNKILNKNTSVNRLNLIPTEISALEIVPKGKTINLPTSFTYYGKVYNITWSWKIGAKNQGVINNGIWTIQAESWNANDEIITLTPSIIGFSLSPYKINVTNIENSTNIKKEYYIETANPDGTASGTYVPASTVFESAKLADFIFMKYGGGYDKPCYYNPNTNRYELSQAVILATTELKLGMAKTGGISTGNIGAGSLKGIEIFKNLKTLILYKGSVVDISPLKDLHLENFIYLNGADNADYFISDFSPLIIGSKDTLKKFEYSAFGNAQIADLSFLSAFTKLENVYISCNNSITNYTEYLTSSSFKYLVSFMTKKNPSINFCVPQLDRIASAFDVVEKNITIYGGTTDGESKKVYKLIPKMEDKQAEYILEKFAVTTNTGTITDNYKLVLNGANNTKNTNIITSKLPSTINDGGVNYIIDYRKASANITVNGYRLSLTKSITVGGKAYTDGTLLNYNQAKALTQTTEFLSLTNSGDLTLLAEISIDTNALAPASKLLAKIMVGGYSYERMLTLDYKSI